MAERKRGSPVPGKVKEKPGHKQNFKTYEQLAAIEEEKRKFEADLNAEERARREASKRFWAWTKYVPTPKRVYKFVFPPDWNKMAMLKLGDTQGKLIETFKYLRVYSRKEKRAWFRLWCGMDKSMTNKVSYMTFRKYFKLTEDTWSRRVYDMMNENLNGSLQFAEFVAFCSKYLFVDKYATEEFSFRLISRRGSTFKPKVSVLDLEDMRQFVRFRFKMQDPKAVHKRALDVLNYMDQDGDGSLYIDEYLLFNKRNPVFVKFTHLWQQHLRKCIFGIKYWVEKSRYIKKEHAAGIDNLSLLFRINLEAENFARVELCDPVTDDRGRTVVTLPYIPPRVFVPTAESELSNPPQTPDTLNTPPPPLSSQPPKAPATLPSIKPSFVIPEDKKMLAWHGPLTTALNLLMIRPYADEFAEVHVLKLEQKARKREQRAKDNDLARAVAAHTYKRLVSVCEDLIYGRKWLRLGFNHWAEAVGMNSVDIGAMKHSAEEQRLVARKRMAKLITKENVKEISLRNVNDASMSKDIAEEQAAKAAAMFGPKSGLSQIAAKLESEGKMVDDMHVRIMENCRKQEEQMDDPDDQCATYVREVFMKRHIAFMQSYRHERMSKFVNDRHEHTPSEETQSSLRQSVLGAAHNYKKRLAYDEDSEPESDAGSV